MKTLLLFVTCLMLTGCFGPSIMYVGGLSITVVDVASIPAKNKIRKHVIKEEKATTNNEQ